MKKILGTFGLIFLLLMVAGYFRNNNAEFKLRCAAYQSNIADDLSFPDKLVCLTWYEIKD